jgi:hypothetical protein
MWTTMKNAVGRSLIQLPQGIHSSLSSGCRRIGAGEAPVLTYFGPAGADVHS